MFNWLSLKICYTIKHFFSFVNNEFSVFKQKQIKCYCSHTTIPRGVLAWICQNPETYEPKFHCRRQSGMNFGYVTVNGVNSNNLIFYVQKQNI